MKLIGLYLVLACSVVAQSTKVGGSGTTLVGGSGTTKVSAVPAASAPAFVEFQASTNQVSASTNSISITVTTGNSIMVGCKWEDNDRTPTCSDGTNTYTALTVTNAGVIHTAGFYIINATGGALTITVSYGSATPQCKAFAIEMSGVTAFDAQGSTGFFGSGTAVTSGSITTPNAVEVLITSIANYDALTVTPQASWTEDSDADALEVQHRVTSSAGSYSGAGTLSGATSGALCTLAAFK